MSSPQIPILSYGRHAEIASAIKARLAPEYDVVHIILTEDVAKTEFPKILSGNLDDDPASGLGSNVQRKIEERLVPKAVVCGGGVPQEEVDEMKRLVGPKADDFIWIKLTLEELDGPPGPETIIPVVKRRLAAAGI